MKILTRYVLVTIALVLLVAVCLTVSNPSDDRALPTAVRTALMSLAIPCHVAFVVMRIDNVHSTGIPALVVTVASIEFVIVVIVRALGRTRGARRGQSLFKVGSRQKEKVESRK